MRSQLRDTRVRRDVSTTRYRNAAERLVFVDIETAGLQVWRPIIQIAAIAVDKSFRELECFEEKILFDESHAVKRSLLKRQYSRRRWQAEARRDKDVAVDFGAFLARHATVRAATARGLTPRADRRASPRAGPRRRAQHGRLELARALARHRRSGLDDVRAVRAACGERHEEESTRVR